MQFYCIFIAGDWSCPHCEMFGPEEHLWNWNRTVLYKKPFLEEVNRNEWVEDALDLPEILDVQDDNSNFDNDSITSIVIDPDDLVEEEEKDEIQDHPPKIVKKPNTNKIIPKMRKPIGTSKGPRKNCPNCNISIDRKSLARHIRNCKTQVVIIETDIADKSIDLDVENDDDGEKPDLLTEVVDELNESAETEIA